MFPKVMNELLGRAAQGHAATLTGWSRHALVSRAYPGAVPAETGSRIEGVVWKNLSENELHILDRFEGDEYLRCLVTLRDSSDALMTAWIYQWKNMSELLGPWDVDQFVCAHLETFVDAHRVD